MIYPLFTGCSLESDFELDNENSFKLHPGMLKIFFDCFQYV